MLFLYRDRLEAGHPRRRCRRVAKPSICVQNNRTVGLFLPTEQPERDGHPPQSRTGEHDWRLSGAVRPFRRRGRVQCLSTAISKTARNGTRLSNGLKVALLPKKTRGSSVTCPIGAALRERPRSLQGLTTAAEILPATDGSRGTKDLTRQQIRDRLDHLASPVSSPSGGSGGSDVLHSKPSRSTSIEALWTSSGKILREPTLPAEEFEIIRTKQVTDLEQKLTDPVSLARQVRRAGRSARTRPKMSGTCRACRGEHHPMERPSNASRRPATALPGLSGWNEHGELSIVGDFDPEAD